jgi:hypothetical protein
LNAFIERWIQSLQHETLDHFFVFGQEYFDFIVSSYVDYFNECRPHQGIGNVLPPRRRDEANEAAGHADDSPPSSVLADIQCERRLGGLLEHFYRDAA